MSIDNNSELGTGFREISIFGKNGPKIRLGPKAHSKSIPENPGVLNGVPVEMRINVGGINVTPVFDGDGVKDLHNLDNPDVVKAVEKAISESPKAKVFEELEKEITEGRKTLKWRPILGGIAIFVAIGAVTLFEAKREYRDFEEFKQRFGKAWRGVRTAKQDNTTG